MFTPKIQNGDTCKYIIGHEVFEGIVSHVNGSKSCELEWQSRPGSPGTRIVCPVDKLVLVKKGNSA